MSVDHDLAAILEVINGGAIEAALTLCRDAEQRYGEHVALFHLHAVALRRHGELVAAIDKMIRLFTLNPGIPGSRENFTVMVVDVIRAVRASRAPDEEAYLAACYRALQAHFTLGARIFADDIVFGVFYLLLWRHRYQWAVDCLYAMSRDAHCAPFLVCKAVAAVADIGFIGEDLVRLGAERGIKLILQNKSDEYSVFCFLFYIYRNNKLDQLERFTSRLIDKPEYKMEIPQSLQQWHITRTSKEFFFTNIIKIKDSIIYDEYHISQAVFDKVVMFSCDEIYWKECAFLLVDDLLAEEAGFIVHINVVNPAPETMARIRAISGDHGQVGYSFFKTATQTFGAFEAGVLLRSVYACSRFLILPDVMKWYGRDVIVMDVDKRLKRPMSQFLNDFSPYFHHDLAINDGGRLGPGREFVCNLSVYSATEAAKNFINIIKNYMIYFIKYDVPYWMIDQAAFFAVYHFMIKDGREIDLFLFRKENICCDDYFFHAAGADIDKEKAMRGFGSED